MSIEKFLQELRSNGYEPVHEIRVNSSGWERLKYNGESGTKASGGYRLIQNPDGSYFANYGSSKDKLGFRSWKPDRSQELTYAESASAKAARESHRRFLEEKEKKKHERIADRLNRVVLRMTLAESHPYLTDKGVAAHGIRIRPKTGDLIIPRYADGKIYSIQRIIQRKPGDKSWKGYFKGARGKGLFYPLYVPDENMAVILFAEGFSTAATIRAATGLPVVCCFDAGSLRAVAIAFKKKYPKSRIVFCADNDQWPNAKGIIQNTGVDKAQSAAAGIGGAHVIWPEFDDKYTDSRPTDFNDAMLLFGKDYVKNRVMTVVNQPIAEPSEIPGLNTSEEAAAGGFDMDSFVDVQSPADGDITVPNSMGMAFRVLGYNNGVYYYYPYGSRQIVALSAPSHSMQNLLQLDNIDNWESPWRDAAGKLTTKHQTIALYAAGRLIPIAEKMGIFSEEARVRGAGCWIDDGRVVLHCGDSLYIDGKHEKFEYFKSEFTYVAALRLMKPANNALGNAEARQLRTICESITWENKLSGTLLAGWLVIAPICAALSYRPHIYITGEAESGKSTVMDKIIKPVLGKMGLYADGGTTEPALRDMMGYDARPLVYDEAEPSPSMVEVIGLARKATTGAVVKKHGQRPFKARFCACFSAINPPVNKTADESRISFMHLKKNLRPNAIEEYNNLLRQIEELITDDFSQRLIARTLENMNYLIANIRIFQSEVRNNIKGARASQQIGTMLAGVYMLGRTDVISEEAAAEIVRRFNYSEHTIIDEAGDPVRLLQWIAASLVRTRTGADISIGELITMVRVGDENQIMHDKLLRSYGIVVDSDRIKIASTGQNLSRLLKDTDWHAKWNRTLSDIPGAQKHKIVYFSPGFKTSAVSVPISYFYESEIEIEPPIEF